MLLKEDFLNSLDQIERNLNKPESIITSKDQLPEILTADTLIKHLGLIAIKGTTDEDGYFKEFINTINDSTLESKTEIFYLLKGGQVSCLHILGTTETWNWIGGQAISIFIFNGQKLEEITLNAATRSHTIKSGTLFGAKIANQSNNNDFVLVTCLCKPGFTPALYKNPTEEQLAVLYRIHDKKIIDELKPRTSIKQKNISQSIFQFFTFCFTCIGVKKSEEQTPLINLQKDK